MGKAAPAGQDTIVAARNFDVQVQTLLTEYKDVKVPNFTSMVGAFSQFEDLEDAKSFPIESKSTAIWCCKHRTRATFGTTWSLTSCHTSIVTIGNGTGKNKWKLVTGPWRGEFFIILSSFLFYYLDSGATTPR